MAGSDWFTNADNYTIFKASLDNSANMFKLAMAKRMQTELAALNDKYDGQKAAGLEDQINSIAEQKYDVSDYLSNVETGLKRIDDVRTELLMAKDAIGRGSNSAFDLAINSINLWIGRQSDNPNSLIANNGNGRGNWSESVSIVSGAGMSVTLSHEFMGSDFAILLPDGRSLRPNKDGDALGSNGIADIPMSDLTMSRGALLTDASGNVTQGTFKVTESTDADGKVTKTGTMTDADGNTITGTVATVAGKTVLTDADGKTYTQSYSDQVTVTAVTRDADGNVVVDGDGNPVTTSYSGTLKTGGLGVLNSSAYGSFKDEDNPDAATARQAASADIDTAIRRLAQMERDLNSYQAGLSGIVNGLDGKASTLADEYNKVANEELDAKQAEQRAIETRYQVATNAMVLSNETTSTMVYQMFYNQPSTEQPSLTDVLLSAVSG